MCRMVPIEYPCHRAGTSASGRRPRPGHCPGAPPSSAWVLPGTAVVQLVISAAQQQIPLDRGPPLVATPELGRTLIQAVLIRTAVSGQLIGMDDNAREQLSDPLQAFFVFSFLNFLHGGTSPHFSLPRPAASWPTRRKPTHPFRTRRRPCRRQTPG